MRRNVTDAVTQYASVYTMGSIALMLICLLLCCNRKPYQVRGTCYNKISFDKTLQQLAFIRICTPNINENIPQ